MMSEAVMVALIAAVPGTLAAIGAWRKSIAATNEIKTLTVSVNGNLAKVMQAIEKAARAEGLAEAALSQTAQETKTIVVPDRRRPDSEK